MTNRLQQKARHTGVRMDQNQEKQENEVRGTSGQEPGQEMEPNARRTQNAQVSDEIQDIYVLVVRERQEEEDEEDFPQVVESTLVLPRESPLLPAYVLCSSYVLLLVAALVFQLYCVFNPPIATVTLLPRFQHVSMTGTVQLGRMVSPITISQSQSVPTSGTGHQDARSATGYLTFYNGQFQAVTIPAGIVLSGASGIWVITDREAVIPAGDPPQYGQVSVPAHTSTQGASGNIAAHDINQACCASSVLVTNVQPFSGGQNARVFQTVAMRDIASTATLLATAVAQSVNAAFQGHLQPREQVALLPCCPIVASDHLIGQEATHITVTVSETCRAVAYNGQQLALQATDMLIHRSAGQLQAGYSLFGSVRASVINAAVSTSAQHQVFLAFKAQGTWVYGLSKPTQEQITHLLAGKTTHEALQLLTALPGVEQASIRFSGFGNASRLPKQVGLIHLTFLVTG